MQPFALPTAPTVLTRAERAPRVGLSAGWMLAGSVAVHGLLALVLSTIDTSALALAPRTGPVAVRLLAPPPPVLPPIEAPPPPLVPEPAPPPTERVRRAEPEPVVEPVAEAAAPEPAAPVTAAPPSLDDVFGDPPPAPGVMTGGAGAGPAMASGPGGVPGGRPGGTGTALGAGAGPAGTEPGEDDALARRRARLAYKRELERLLRERRAYPRAALRDRLEGRVELALRIGRDGTVLNVRVAESSGYALLDSAALEAAHLEHVPAPPEAAELTERDEILIPINYVVR